MHEQKITLVHSAPKSLIWKNYLFSLEVPAKVLLYLVDSYSSTALWPRECEVQIVWGRAMYPAFEFED